MTSLTFGTRKEAPTSSQEHMRDPTADDPTADAPAPGESKADDSTPGAPVAGDSTAPRKNAQAIAALRPKEKIDAIFTCTRKARHISRIGTPYLAIVLRDSTGTIFARAFRDADMLAERFEEGEVVRVHGRAEVFRDKLQVAIDAIARVEGAKADPYHVLPVTRRDLDELEGFLEHLSREVYDPGLKELLGRLLGDRKLRAEIRRAPCAVPAFESEAGGSGLAASHHAYLGGMLEHTIAVATMALELCTLHPHLDSDLLLSAAIVHDLGKTREFTYDGEIEYSHQGRLLGHVELGLRLLSRHAPPALKYERRLALEHCVILHHGPDSACGQRFASAEALALYRLNTLDAQVSGAFEHGISR
jgi:3'-5' exoribonuclease